MKEPFILNNRYLVSAEKNTVSDQEMQEESRLEQRFIEVLMMLAENPNQLVTREKIIRSVWNDYGGADEGLTQSISYLRKVLNDTDKTIIETIPKKGYILNASLTRAGTANPPQKRKRVPVYVTVLLILIICAGTIYLISTSMNTGGHPSDVVPNLDMKQGDIKSEDVRHDTPHVNSPDILPDSQINKP